MTLLNNALDVNFVNSDNVSWQAIQTSNFTASSGFGYFIDTTSSIITVTLPLTPSAYDIVAIADCTGTFSSNNCTIDLNGHLSCGSLTNIVLQENYSSVSLVYIDAVQGWLPYYSVRTPDFFTSVYTFSYSVVAGGGSGGVGGGGGGGGVLTGIHITPAKLSYSVIVGAGGATAYNNGVLLNTDSNGINSSIIGQELSAVAIGGGSGGTIYTGHGGGYDSGNGGEYRGSAGGSGGGSGGLAQARSYRLLGGTAQFGQGYNGGVLEGDATGVASGGGGGGCNGGFNVINYSSWWGTTYGSGNGGTGVNLSIAGGGYVYGVVAGGGGGNGLAGNPGGGGDGGGGDGGGGGGTVNTGGGGGGTEGGTAGDGGSGIVVISYANPTQLGTGGDSVTSIVVGITTYWVHAFTSSGTYTA